MKEFKAHLKLMGGLSTAKIDHYAKEFQLIADKQVEEALESLKLRNSGWTCLECGCLLNSKGKCSTCL